MGKKLFISSNQYVICSHYPITDALAPKSNLMKAAPELLNALECIYNDKEVWSELSDTQKTMVEQSIKKAIK